MREIGSAISTGLLLVLTFPNFDLPFLAWIALVPLLLACADAESTGRRFLLGWIAGVVFFLGTCFWCFGVMHHYGNLSVFASTGVLLAMVAGLALYWGLFAAVLPVAFDNAWMTLLGTGALWTACEFARGHVFIAFPWLFIGYATTDHMLLAKLSTITGVYGLSFVVAAFNAGIFLVIREQRREWGIRLAVSFFALSGLVIGGALLKTEHGMETAYLLQTNVPLDQDWSGDYRDRLLRETETALVAAYARNDSRSGVVIWPETPAPLYYEEDLALRLYLSRLSRETGSTMLVNTVTFVRGDVLKPLNSVVDIGADGGRHAQYDKIELVPFGEHIPYASLFFFAGKLTAEVGDFVPGLRYQLMPGPKDLPFAATICYEAGFPELVRALVDRGAGAIVNVSNDGWFGDSPARRQHLLMARMRAIENDRWMLRSTNDGLTAVIDPDGRVEVFPGARRAAFVAHYALKRDRTIYTRAGDWFAFLCIGASGVLVLRTTRRKEL